MANDLNASVDAKVKLSPPVVNGRYTDAQYTELAGHAVKVLDNKLYILTFDRTGSGSWFWELVRDQR